MADVARQGAVMTAPEQVDRAKVLQRLRVNDAIFRAMTRTAAIAVLVILGAIIVSLVYGSMPALSKSR